VIVIKEKRVKVFIIGETVDCARWTKLF